MNVRKNIPARPKASPKYEARVPASKIREAPSPQTSGFVLVLVGVSLMLLSGWGTFSSGTAVSEELRGGDKGGAVISGTAGGNDLFGEAGDDSIETKDGVKDHVSCDSGEDVASVDGLDVVASDCGTVYRLAAP